MNLHVAIPGDRFITLQCVCVCLLLLILLQFPMDIFGGGVACA